MCQEPVSCTDMTSDKIQQLLTIRKKNTTIIGTAQALWLPCKILTFKKGLFTTIINDNFYFLHCKSGLHIYTLLLWRKARYKSVSSEKQDEYAEGQDLSIPTWKIRARHIKCADVYFSTSNVHGHQDPHCV